MSQKFHQLQHNCGLSTKGAAMLLREDVSKVRRWKHQRTRTPADVISKLEQLQRAVHVIFGKKTKDNDSNTAYE